LGPESLVAQGVEGSNERIGLCGFWRIARGGIDTVLVFFWKHRDPDKGSRALSPLMSQPQPI